MLRMKKLVLAAAALLVSLGANAQFESGKQYCGASLTGLNLSYNGSQDLNFGVQAKAGYFVEDDWMLLGHVEYTHSGQDGVKDYFLPELRPDIISSRMDCISVLVPRWLIRAATMTSCLAWR